MTEPLNYEKVMDKALSTLSKAVSEWSAKNTPEHITQAVFNALDKNKEVIILKLLGFTNTWGKWDLDNNSRANTSEAQMHLSGLKKKAIEAWFSQITIPKMTVSIKRSIEAEARRVYEREVDDHLTDLVKTKAAADAKAIMEAMCSSDNVTNHLKMLKLLNPEN